MAAAVTRPSAATATPRGIRGCRGTVHPPTARSHVPAGRDSAPSVVLARRREIPVDRPESELLNPRFNVPSSRGLGRGSSPVPVNRPVGTDDFVLHPRTPERGARGPFQRHDGRRRIAETCSGRPAVRTALHECLRGCDLGRGAVESSDPKLLVPETSRRNTCPKRAKSPHGGDQCRRRILLV